MKEVKVIYLVGDTVWLWGLGYLIFGWWWNLIVRKPSTQTRIDKQLKKYAEEGWTIAPFNTEAGKSVLFGFYKSVGWLVALTK